jgi:hypothetical protein
MVNTSKINKKTKALTLFKKVKIKKSTSPNPLDKFKQKLTEQSTTSTKTQFDELLNRELEVELPMGSQKGVNTPALIDAKLDDKIKLANQISYSGLGDINLVNEAVSEPLTSEFYVVEFAELDMENLKLKLQELQNTKTIVEDKDLQIQALQELIKENIDVSEKVNGE